MATPEHVPVLLERCSGLLGPALGDAQRIVVDATLGLGGHSEALLERFPARLIGLDRDTRALELSRERLARFGERFTGVHAVYDELPEVLADLGIRHIHGILFDLGVSSMQLDEDDRGFTYARDAPLDMRMDQGRGRTAAEILNEESASRLAHILRVYGEEKFAKRIADLIVKERSSAPIETSGALVDLVRRAIPAPARRQGGNPAKRTFQALRIEVNDELAVLERAVPAALASLAVGGRAVFMSYQSLEDRIVKSAITPLAEVQAPPGLPIVPEYLQPTMQLLTRSSERPSAEEEAANPRAASARLRAVERIRKAR